MLNRDGNLSICSAAKVLRDAAETLLTEPSLPDCVDEDQVCIPMSQLLLLARAVRFQEQAWAHVAFSDCKLRTCRSSQLTAVQTVQPSSCAAACLKLAKTFWSR